MAKEKKYYISVFSRDGLDYGDNEVEIHNTKESALKTLHSWIDDAKSILESQEGDPEFFVFEAVEVPLNVEKCVTPTIKIRFA